MKVIDITGRIYDNMWFYGEPLKRFKLEKKEMSHAGEKYTIEIFNGLSANTGTYIEATGSESPIDNISLESLIDINAYVYQIPFETLKIKDGRPYISVDDLKGAEKEEVLPNSAILLSTGYGKKWEDPEYLEKTWFLKKEAMLYIIDKKPFMLGGDSANWENGTNPEGIFEPFGKANIIMLSSCDNLENVEKFKVKLTVFPLKIINLRANCPVRALIEE